MLLVSVLFYVLKIIMVCVFVLICVFRYVVIVCVFMLRIWCIRFGCEYVIDFIVWKLFELLFLIM